MLQLMYRSLVCTSLLALSACGAIDGGSDDATFHLRGVNLITDSPTVKFYFNDTSVATTTFNGASTWQAAEAGSFNVKFKVVHPANLNSDTTDDVNETDIGSTISQAFTKDRDYTLFAYGTMADPRMIVLDATDQRDNPDDNIVAYQVANVSPNAQSVDVYITAPEASIPTAQLVGTLAPGQYTEPTNLTVQPEADAISDDATRTVDITIELREAGTNNVIFTSTALTISEQTRLLFAVADNVGAGPSPVKVLEVVGGSTTLIQEPDDQAKLRFVNMVQGSPALDVAAGSFQRLIAQSVAFRGESAYSKTANGEVGLIGTQAGNTSSFAFIEEFTALADQSYSAYAIGTTSDLDATVVAEDDRIVPTQARFRFLDAAPSLKDKLLDIYVLQANGSIHFPDDNTSTTDTSPSFSSVSYKSATTYLTLEGGAFDAYIALAGTETILVGPVRLDVSNGTNQTFVLTDNESAALEVIPFLDTSP